MFCQRLTGRQLTILKIAYVLSTGWQVDRSDNSNTGQLRCQLSTVSTGRQLTILMTIVMHCRRLTGRQLTLLILHYKNCQLSTCQSSTIHYRIIRIVNCRPVNRRQNICKIRIRIVNCRPVDHSINTWLLSELLTVDMSTVDNTLWIVRPVTCQLSTCQPSTIHTHYKNCQLSICQPSTKHYRQN